MDGREKSDRSVVPRKRSNKAARAAAEAVEGRGRGKGNVVQQNAQRTQSRASAPQALDRVREAARRDKKARFTALMHHVTEQRLREAFEALAKQAAPGVDGVTWQQYGEGLEAKLRDLHRRLHQGAYRAKPSRRAYIPKADGRLRPLGVAALEDKVVQRALVEVLEAIYEEDFVSFSYGFRPGRGPHDALDALAYGIRGDFVVGFQHRDDAERFLAELSKRMRSFGLELHPDKTRLIEFGRYAAERRLRQGQGRPETFDFLGFTHICGRSRDSKHFVLMRHTIRRRMQAKLREVKAQLQSRRHAPPDEQGRWLGRVVAGYFEYYAVPTNTRAIGVFRDEVAKRWRQALRRRGSHRGAQWRHLHRHVAQWLPPARIQHPWPDERFLVNDPSQEPSAVVPHARICAGGPG
jgi:hypothetical protein